MVQIEKIKSFLKLISEISKNNVVIDSNLVYSNLIIQGTSKQNINDLFPRWIERYKHNKDIRVFIEDNWKYFCQFKGNDDKVPDYSKMKLYIPLDKEHIYEGANRLFDFISQNKIPHESKISSHTRMDDIVIRTDTKEDALKIANFVKSDSYINKGLISPNVFAFNDVISYAWDGDLSYNTVVSEWISDYINSLKEENRLDYVSYIGFYTFVQENYTNIFLKGIKINEFINSRNTRNKEDIVANLINYHNVTRLLLTVLNPRSTLEDLFNSVKIFTDPEYEREMNSRFKDFVNIKKEDEELSNEEIEVIDYIYGEMLKKYSEEEVINIFKAFSIDGNYKYFTRDFNIRNIVMSNNITKNKMQKRVLMYQKEALMNAALDTTIKYGLAQLKAALISMKMNDYKMFTNENGVREELKRLVLPIELDGVITEIGKDKKMYPTTINEKYEMFAKIVEDNLRRVK